MRNGASWARVGAEVLYRQLELAEAVAQSSERAFQPFLDSPEVRARQLDVGGLQLVQLDIQRDPAGQPQLHRAQAGEALLDAGHPSAQLTLRVGAGEVQADGLGTGAGLDAGCG